jgi:two-component system response regulator CpxR
MQAHPAPTPERARLLLVDDDRGLARMLREFLELQGFEVELAHDGETALGRIDAAPPDLVVLDVTLPGLSGFEVLARLRSASQLPVVMLTARGEESDRIAGLMGGADDYLAKPFNPLELAARVRAVLKRSRAPAVPAAVAAAPDRLLLGPIRLDLRRRELQVHGLAVALTAAEMRVLAELLRRPGEVISRAELTQVALERPLEAYDRSIDTLASRLRRKLAAAGLPAEAIRGLRGHGYVLELPESTGTPSHRP